MRDSVSAPSRSGFYGVSRVCPIQPAAFAPWHGIRAQAARALIMAMGWPERLGMERPAPSGRETPAELSHRVLLPNKWRGKSQGCRESKRAVIRNRCRATSLAPTVYATFTSIALDLGFSVLGRWTKRMPSLKSAVSLSSATFSGSVNERKKLPYELSIR